MFRKILEFVKKNFLLLCTYVLIFIAGYSGNPWAIFIALYIALIVESEKE